MPEPGDGGVITEPAAADLKFKMEREGHVSRDPGYPRHGRRGRGIRYFQLLASLPARTKSYVTVNHQGIHVEASIAAGAAACKG